MESTPTNMWTTLLWFGAIAVVMYFMLIRPQQQERKKHQGMVNELRKGNHVILSSGFYGEIIDIKDNVILVNIADDENSKLVVRVSKYAVQNVLGKEDKPKEQSK